jgi:ERF superfamily
VTPLDQDEGTAPQREWVAAWVAALGELEEVPRKQVANAGPYSYRYATLGDVLSYVRPVLTRHGLSVTQIPETEPDTVIVTTIITHTAGDERSFPPLRLPAGRTPQAIGSAITYARRYDLMSILGLATEDDDGAAAAPPLISQANLDRFNAAVAELSAEEVGDVVATATAGRTRDPAEVHANEVQALREALNAIARTPATPT